MTIHGKSPLCFGVDRCQLLREETNLYKTYAFDVSFGNNEASLTIRAKTLEVALQIIEAYGQMYQIYNQTPEQYHRFVAENKDKVMRLKVSKERAYDNKEMPMINYVNRIKDFVFGAGKCTSSQTRAEGKRMIKEALPSFKEKKPVKSLHFTVYRPNPVTDELKRINSYSKKIEDEKRDYRVFEEEAEDIRIQNNIKERVR